MQVDPIRPTLKAPRTKRLKLNCGEPLSNYAFNFNLRRYNLAGLDDDLIELLNLKILHKSHFLKACGR